MHFAYFIFSLNYPTKGLVLVNEKGGVVLAVCGLIPSRTCSVFLRQSTIR